MPVNAPTLDNPLDAVASRLREICGDHELLKSSIDAGSIRRMLVHIRNINFAVLASTRDHVNASKRLNDFAFTLARVAKNAEPPNAALATRLASVAANLRAASEELAGSDSVPNWRLPADARAHLDLSADSAGSAPGSKPDQLHRWEDDGGSTAPVPASDGTDQVAITLPAASPPARR